MTDLFDNPPENPLGLDGFEFLEFSAPDKGVLEASFAAMGFNLVARHRSKDVQLWRQGQINFVANYEPKSPAAYFAAEHGPSACGMGFRVRDAGNAYAEALARGAEPADVRTGQPVQLTVEGDPEVHTGRVARISPSIREDSRTLSVRNTMRGSGDHHSGGCPAENHGKMPCR